MGLSPWSTPYQLWLEKTGRASAKVTQAMQRGTEELEPSARAAYEAQIRSGDAAAGDRGRCLQRQSGRHDIGR
ncbi:hypothetical protein MASR1M50_01080 [Burkholderiales bacterium]